MGRFPGLMVYFYLYFRCHSTHNTCHAWREDPGDEIGLVCCSEVIDKLIVFIERAYYGWTSRKGLVLVDGGLDRVRTVWREKKEIKIVNKQAATVESFIDGHRVKNIIS